MADQPNNTAEAPQSDAAPSASTMNAVFGMSETAPEPSKEQNAAESRDAAATANMLGLSRDDATERANEAARGYIDSNAGERARGADGKFLPGDATQPKKTARDADYAKPAAAKPTKDEGDEDESQEAEEGKDAPSESPKSGSRYAILSAIGVDEAHQTAEGFAALVEAADKLAKYNKDEGSGAPSQDRGTGRPQGDRSAAPSKDNGGTGKGSKADSATATDSEQDYDTKIFTQAEIKELEETEGRTAALLAVQHNREVRRELAKREEQSRESDQKALRTLANEVVLPAFWKAVQDVPALRAVYGDPNRTEEALTKSEIEAMQPVINEAQTMMENSKYSSEFKQPITFAQAMTMAIARHHREDYAKHSDTKGKSDAEVKRRHGARTLSPSGSARGGGDSVREANSMARSYLAQKR